jgi:hypothetical protein
MYLNSALPVSVSATGLRVFISQYFFFEDEQNIPVVTVLFPPWLPFFAIPCYIPGPLVGCAEGTFI